jgi:serine/threonine protein kinase
VGALAEHVLGRYILLDELAAGGMATVHLGRLLGPVGFAKTVAVKRLHPHYAKDASFRAMLIDEARLAARIRHTNVVQTLDVITAEEEILLVMEYIHGESLSKLSRAMQARGERIPVPITASILSGMLHGLHAAHEATDDQGRSLGVVHRDVSPQNVLVATDGGSRLIDFGVAKATGRLHVTREGEIKGKLAYMAPEQLSGHVSRQTDVYAASVVLWEALTGKRLFPAIDEREIVSKILHATIKAPSEVSSVDPALDEIVMRGLSRDVSERWPSARDMARALEENVVLASSGQVGEWVELVGGEALAARRTRLREVEAMGPAQIATLSGPKALDAASAIRPILDPKSTISVSMPAQLPARRSLARSVLVPLVVFLAGVASTAVFIRWRLSPVPVAAVPMPIRSTAPPFPSATASSASVPVSPPPPPTEPVAASAAPGMHTARTSPRRAPAPAAIHSTSEAAAPAPPTRTCDPPFRLGPRGEKIWIPECISEGQ